MDDSRFSRDVHNIAMSKAADLVVLLRSPMVDELSVLVFMSVSLGAPIPRKVYLNKQYGLASLVSRYRGELKYLYMKKTYMTLTEEVYVCSQNAVLHTELFNSKLLAASTKLVYRLDRIFGD